ncbi:Hypothetical predicted protein [Paramuricea clavata]|uniref:Uncharacterized protein n=1 Tax=Paramuricea clavata TaxID=317549 RepID=A0A6S7H1W3_PARCT|nr:Hypothetical predicted protein [Paramuricea clavata]
MYDFVFNFPTCIPDAIHVGKSLKCSFCNWYILLNGQRSNLAILRTLRDDSDPETRKLFRKLLKDGDAVRNKDRMAVDAILDLMAENFIRAVENVEFAVHALVPERFKFTEDNNVGAFPHPVDITNAGSGILFMLDFAPLKEHKHTSQLSIKVQSLRKAELIVELTKRGVEATGNVTQLKNKLNLENEKLRAQYASVKKRTDIVHLNKDIHTVDCLSSASDEILIVGSNVDQKVYQVLIEKDGVGLVGSVTQSFTYPQNDIKVVSMTTSTGSLFFSSVGPQGQDDYGGLFQVNLESNLPTCLVRNSPNCEVHGIAPYKNGIAFSDIKTNQIKQYHCLSGVSILAGNGKEGNVKGNAKFASFMQPAGLCSELDTNLFLCNSQNGEVVLITGLQGTCEFLSSIGKMFRAFSIHKKHNFLAPLPTVGLHHIVR